MSTRLEARSIVVTGGFGALGRAVAQRLVEDGAHVTLVDRAAAPAGGLPAGVAVVLGGVDLSDEAACAAAYARVRVAAGGIDGVVNVAGGFAWEPIEGGALETWDRLYTMNVRTAVASCRAALPHLLARGAGRIVNVGALAAQKAGMGMAAYAASKSGVARLTESLAEELKDRGVTVNAVLPSIIDTPANRADMPDADASRWVAPDKLAAVIAFLLSDDASAVTGACVPVSGRV
ncbi:SDR family NAD(P)-dependent oxidoreductase [Aromatoleum toluolicum]|uniref:SDR family NAD(P)-dependent oxidoreductase n=2 Tax=Aromatoleum TaxID=551759 RepID=A0ABX1NIS6_9RHOO|nr:MULTISPECIES: SDR family NAD(P)-dependent oxidoreductase [Rhodocyclales]KAI5913347.1 SDR family NAD(P)-dependent oxidoreductase [Thauera sp. 2A1]NMF87059.1 SDR family NAD(P)-dependent oxidoreductase [Aromatoleum petrolei]NMF99208.1 SDR family NAD(P)-dependent oxidoreductase [Aromatoleum toluolicum]QTQ34796.1 Short chain dehydrogenase/reductase family protein [Aromatoleum petrolei]